MCNGFFNKQKNHGGCTDCSSHHHPERKCANVRKFTREKNVKFCRAGGPGRTLDAPGSNLFTGGFFLLLKERKRITVIFFMISFF
jgi:hypothetical protein